ncbi:peptidoglycan-binding domain-containing protein [Aurantimonas marianensis]|uniref:Peptidoglycan-binding protein n=1 Tax=Aurantimonas marianensis TaxID=2920428 RepID=A0A9X2H414_9HYPH|nr:peptidoglycan-binding protein [Aurantimonas marianensis]MCP3054862.1 peptidoglycan-binding protein [Aurantimonas marianensis]
MASAAGMWRRPALSVGLTAFGVLFAGMAGNAIYGQAGPHPNPMLATRGDGESAERPHLANTQGLMPVPLVREVQAGLAAIGHYRAPVDGKPGPATEAAIRDFQKTHGLTTDGAATPLLLAQIRQAAAEAPNPSRRPDEFASLDERMGGGSGGGSAEIPEGLAESGLAALDQEELVRRIQAGLTAAQVAELSSDGIPGERTRAAIRTFEALEGLEITGSPDARILERLIEIGAVD